ncbi:N-acetylglucosamine-6-phosphate deacetylase [Herbiconiux moechotypicola]|uniref:N-acetylglucosamine-6-phosphate deacetylase n=1 Tax=Herbiconiux moechotypicola TaxID=637393 RepID=A0ABN3DS72_9MICO|nr:N-acetylglucosamine-6-phosphate deacetylase [Herbiconiux moechotypicola]MCS5730636.1 N-acetylglucosamine-6-phosphate deacetylase [Herbiconiux moechotypicola]
MTGPAGASSSSAFAAPTLVVRGARKLDADGVVDDFWLAAASGHIVATGAGSPPPAFSTATTTIDAAGDWLCPGFTDLHVHGGNGHSFDDGIDGMRAGLAFHRTHGTARSLVSLVSNPPHVLDALLDAVARLAGDDPRVLGAHLEGPFLAPARKGAHNPLYLGLPTRHLVRELLAASEGRLAQITLAPELPGALEAIEVFAASGVAVAVGHTEADHALARAAFDRGASILTHAFNAMPGLHHRAPGPVAAAIDNERVTLELIADGVHVHPSLIDLAFQAAPGRIALVTDAMSAAGAPDGDYHLGSLEVAVTDGRAVLAGTDTIAGSTLTLDRALRVTVDAGVDPVAAIAAVTTTPLRALGLASSAPGLADCGLLRVGQPADLVLLAPDFGRSRPLTAA